MISAINPQLQQKTLRTRRGQYSVYTNNEIGQTNGFPILFAKNHTHKLDLSVTMIPKSFLRKDKKLQGIFYQNLSVLQTIRSPYVVRLYQKVQTFNNQYLFQEYCETNLQSIIQQNRLLNKSLSQKQCITFLKQICSGYDCFFKAGIMHLNLTPKNIKVHKGKAKISDFWFSQTHNVNIYGVQKLLYSTMYSALQLGKNKKFLQKSDTWSIGLIFYTLLHNKLPYQTNSIQQFFDIIQQKGQIPIYRYDLKQSTKDFLNKTLKVNYKQRIQWNDLLNHEIFEDFFSVFKLQNKTVEQEIQIIMKSLQFYINKNNLNIKQLMKQFGLLDNNQIKQDQLFNFLKKIDEKYVNHNNMIYLWNKIDMDKSGTVSSFQLQHVLKQYGIQFPKLYIQFPTEIKQKKQKKVTWADERPAQNDILQECFKQIHIKNNQARRSLFDLFKQYDRKKQGSLNEDQFIELLKRFTLGINDYEAKKAFELLDTDKSKSIEFNEMQYFYYKVNYNFIYRPSQIY